MNRFLVGSSIATCLILSTAPALSQQSISHEDHASATVPAPDASHGQTYGGSGEATVVPSVSSAQPVMAGKNADITLTLKTKDGKPVTLADLEVVHEQPIHLLIVDPSLGDYHHIHPKPGATPGTYAFSFTPKKGGTYFVFNDLHPKSTGIQEYSLAKLEVPGAAAEPVRKNDKREFTADGYTFKLQFEDPHLVQGKSTSATVTVIGPDGKPFDKLEPLMGAFAHMVGFSDDRQNVAHIHPLGKEPGSPAERGGPRLSFHVGLAHPGYHELYTQVQINGKDVFAHFGVEVAPRQVPSDAAGIMKEVDATVEKLDNIANFGPLHKVHEFAFNARDLMLALPAATTSLDPAKKSQLDMSLKKIKSYAGLLDKYGDSKDAAQSQAMMKRFKAEVAEIHNILGLNSAATADQATPLRNSLCPISGQPVGSMEAGAAIVYSGQKVGLCCNGCQAMFMKDPEAALKKAQESAQK